MKKPVLPRFAGLVVLYSAVLAILVMVQFARQGNFTVRIGNLVVTGRYADEETSGTRRNNPGEHSLAGGASVYFGGLEFRVSGDDDEDIVLIDNEGNRKAVSPEALVLSDDAAAFRFPGGTELSFNTRYTGGSPELRISGTFAEEAAGLELPYKPLKSSKVRNSGDGEMVISSGGINYTFGRQPRDPAGLISLKNGEIPISYRAIPEKKAFSPEDFTVSGAESPEAYKDALLRWRDQNFSIWNRTVSDRADEDIIIAYEGEAVRRGNYKAAVSAVPPSFLSGSQRTYESSVYLGRMDYALVSFTAAEREKISRLSHLINEKSQDFLGEAHVFEYLAVRGYLNFLSDGIELVRAIDPPALAPELAPGIFEGYIDMKQYRSRDENPFERLADQACFVISEGIRRDGDRVFVFRGDTADVEYNLRLGNSLLAWAQDSGSSVWAGVGRSLVLSALSLTGGEGTVPAALAISEEGIISEISGQRISSARIYRTLRPGEYYPRAAGIGAGINGIWTWTTALSVSASQETNVLDISVSFPAGETHYMMIRGVRPFEKIQLYNIDYRTDPQFERYDSSGWVYSAQDQILVLKMKHRASTEHIRIFY
jgi:hypothetical protein